MTRIAILGAGVMGSALSYPLTDNGHQVNLIGTHLDDATIAQIKVDATHPKLQRRLPDGVTPFAFADISAGLANADVIALGVSSRGVTWAAHAIGPYLRPGQPVIMVTKGLTAHHDGTLEIFPTTLEAALPTSLRGQIPIAAIGGPSIAQELAARRQTYVVFTSRDQATLDQLAPLFATPYYHIWTSTDVIGVEVCVALKNVYALGVGLIPGVLEAAGGVDINAAMHNHAAAFFAQGLAEMTEIVQLLGGRIETVFSLPGAGDLYVTCQGGRNGRMGAMLGSGVDPEEANERMQGDTVEGVEAVSVIAPAIEKLIARDILRPEAMPLLRHIYAVAIKGHTAGTFVNSFFRQPALQLQPVES